MKDWKEIARVQAPGIPPGDVDRLTGPMERLEREFRPLCDDLTPEIEPATVFLPEADSE